MKHYTQYKYYVCQAKKYSDNILKTFKSDMLINETKYNHLVNEVKHTKTRNNSVN